MVLLLAPGLGQAVGVADTGSGPVLVGDDAVDKVLGDTQTAVGYASGLGLDLVVTGSDVDDGEEHHDNGGEGQALLHKDVLRDDASQIVLVHDESQFDNARGLRCWGLDTSSQVILVQVMSGYSPDCMADQIQKVK